MERSLKTRYEIESKEKRGRSNKVEKNRVLVEEFRRLTRSNLETRNGEHPVESDVYIFVLLSV